MHPLYVYIRAPIYICVWLEYRESEGGPCSLGRLARKRISLWSCLICILTCSRTHTEAPDTPSWCRPWTSQGAAGRSWRQKHITAERLRSQRPLSPLYSTQHCTSPAVREREKEKKRELEEVCVYVCAWMCMNLLICLCVRAVYPNFIQQRY